MRGGGWGHFANDPSIVSETNDMVEDEGSSSDLIPESKTRKVRSL